MGDEGDNTQVKQALPYCAPEAIPKSVKESFAPKKNADFSSVPRL